MRSVKPMKAAKISYIVISSLLCAFGIVMMAMPQLSVTVVGTVLGIAMIVFGIVKLAAYFSKDLFRLAFQYDLAFGILLIALGVLVLLQPDGAMSFFCIVLGICVLTDGLFKIQIALDAKRFGIEKWWVVFILQLFIVLVQCVRALVADDFYTQPCYANVQNSVEQQRNIFQETCSAWHFSMIWRSEFC